MDQRIEDWSQGRSQKSMDRLELGRLLSGTPNMVARRHKADSKAYSMQASVSALSAGNGVVWIGTHTSTAALVINTNI